MHCAIISFTSTGKLLTGLERLDIKFMLEHGKRGVDMIESLLQAPRNIPLKFWWNAELTLLALDTMTQADILLTEYQSMYIVLVNLLVKPILLKLFLQPMDYGVLRSYAELCIRNLRATAFLLLRIIRGALLNNGRLPDLNGEFKLALERLSWRAEVRYEDKPFKPIFTSYQADIAKGEERLRSWAQSILKALQVHRQRKLLGEKGVGRAMGSALSLGAGMAVGEMNPAPPDGEKKASLSASEDDEPVEGVEAEEFTPGKRSEANLAAPGTRRRRETTPRPSAEDQALPSSGATRGERMRAAGSAAVNTTIGSRATLNR